MRPARLASAFALAALLASVTPNAALAADPHQSSGFTVLQPVARDVGTSIAHAPQADHSRESARREIPLKAAAGGIPGRPKPGGATDGALQTSATTASAILPAGVNVDGVGLGITPTYNDCCTPPDTNLAVGTTQVVQWVNLDLAAFDKATGLLLPGYPKAGNSIWAGFGTGCEVNNDGDPIVKFDAQAQRWIMTQFSVSTAPYLQCVAVSNTADFTTTTWNRYAYSFGSNFPDYPKVGIWPDGYYFSFNMFRNGATFMGAAACAFDAATGRAGGSATMQCFQFGTSVGRLLTGDLDGNTGALGTTAAPPAGSPGYFANFGSNALNLWKFHVDFINSASSTLTALPSLATAAFSQACGGGTCVPQAGTAQKLDSLGDRLMYRLAYRNFGAYESLTVAHSVQGSGTAAPRWYELRSGGGAWSIAQQSSYAPDATYRWMGSAAQDKQGNLAIGYSASSSSIPPQIRYTGRSAADPAGTLQQEVAVPLPSTGSETGPYSRWGDYSSMTIDPADDCTFWYTTEYYKATGGSFTWSTRIVNFKFGTCQ
jgi:hypothetical protein